jgi:hypothetical protein
MKRSGVVAIGLACCLLMMPHAATSQAPGDDLAKQMRPSTGIEPAPEPWWADWPTWVVIAGVALLGLALGGALAVRLAHRKRDAASPASPHAWAIQELARLDAGPLAKSGQPDAYHTALSLVVRRYLEQRFKLQATKQTTPEFLAEMRSAKHLNGDQQALLRDFLERCDLVKFAGVKPTVQQCFELSAAAKRFIQQTA